MSMSLIVLLMRWLFSFSFFDFFYIDFLFYATRYSVFMFFPLHPGGMVAGFVVVQYYCSTALHPTTE
jgi:hypothetical protein